MWDKITIWGKIPRFRGEISDFRTKNKRNYASADDAVSHF